MACDYPRCECMNDPGECLFGMMQVNNPSHGGKVTCYKCNGFNQQKDLVPYWDHQHKTEFPKEHFHKECYNPYQHYYGLDKPID